MVNLSVRASVPVPFAYQTMTEGNPVKDARRKIEQFLDHIDEETAWDVVDYNPDVDPYQLTTVTLTAEFQPESDKDDEPKGRIVIQTILETIEKLESDGDGGAEISAVINQVTDNLNVTEETVEYHIQRLKESGEIYEHPGKQLRVI